MSSKLVTPNGEEVNPKQSPALNKYEIACVTALVPATDDPILNRIITAGLKFRTAAQAMSYNPQLSAADAVKLASDLLTEMRK